LTARQTPFHRIQQYLSDQKTIPENKIRLLPRGWKRVGEVGILELNPQLYPWKNEIGEVYLKFLPELKTIAHKIGTTTTITRKPDFEILAGAPDTVTLHKELGCKFWIDALKLTFSSGNHAERHRMMNINQKREQVIDMFACVGNLSIPLAVHNPKTTLIGIEINPLAYKFLVKNIQENHIETQYQAILGDNRLITPKNWANRVLMGYFNIDTTQLSNALTSLQQDQGGIIHAHGLSSTKDPSDWQSKITNIIADSFPHFKIKTTEKRIIKTVAAGIQHYVNDIYIESNK
jgi:tRNA wybutosine-synthesizing protein 2